jgi:hypothetical protein
VVITLSGYRVDDGALWAGKSRLVDGNIPDQIKAARSHIVNLEQ